MKVTLEKNIHYRDWWTIYSASGRPLASSTSWARMKARYEHILEKVRRGKLLNLQIWAEDEHRKAVGRRS